MQPDISAFLAKAEAYHGHLCSGQILGIRLMLKGLELLGLSPLDKLRDLVVFVESDRCIADTVYVVAGLTLGRRRLKLVDYGKTAMSFLDLKTGKAFRVWVCTEDRPEHGITREQLLAFWEARPDSQILAWKEVEISLPPQDLPGPPVRMVTCASCGETILDGRDIVQDGKPFCIACSQNAYYRS